MLNNAATPKRPRGRPKGTTKPDKAQKYKYNLNLTLQAKDWLKEKGGSQYIEEMARQ